MALMGYNIWKNKPLPNLDGKPQAASLLTTARLWLQERGEQ